MLQSFFVSLFAVSVCLILNCNVCFEIEIKDQLIFIISKVFFSPFFSGVHIPLNKPLACLKVPDACNLKNLELDKKCLQ